MRVPWWRAGRRRDARPSRSRLTESPSGPACPRRRLVAAAEGASGAPADGDARPVLPFGSNRPSAGPSADSMSTIEQRLARLSPDRLLGMRPGIEKESLRVQANGALAMTPHPSALGSALTHPHITTDFSESQLELITGVHAGVESCLDELTQLHQFTYRVLEPASEMLWVSSMPCGLQIGRAHV